MKTVMAFWAATIVFLSGLLFWRNRRKYPGKALLWLITKSGTELALLIVSAIRLPALLCAWIGLWVTRPIKEPWLRTTVGILVAAALGYMSIFAMEVILILSVFSIDEVTGESTGFLKNFNEAKAADKKHSQVSVAA